MGKGQMPEIASILLQFAPWVKTILVVILLLVALIQVVRLAPPIRRRGDAIADADQLSQLPGRSAPVILTDTGLNVSPKVDM